MRILHTMLRVADLERSLRFYTEVLGMRLLRRKDYPEGKFTLAFVGYGDETDTAVIELTHNWGVDKYELGNAFGHIAVAVEDAHKACEEVQPALFVVRLDDDVGEDCGRNGDLRADDETLGVLLLLLDEFDLAEP